MNEKIRTKEVRLVGNEGEQFGVVSLEAALAKAKESDLDLMLVAQTAKPPVCKLVNFGQFKYQQQKKEKQSKKMSKAHVTKELKLSPKISEHDFMVRVSRGREFLGKGHKIKITVMFRGREIIHPELGHGVIEKFLEKIADIGVLESRSQSGRMMLAFVNPK